MASKSRGKLREHVQRQLQTSSSFGQGILGKVYKVTGLSGEQYALKVTGYLDATEKEEEYLRTEVEILSRFQHPHIIQYIDGWDTRDSQGQLRGYVLTEYCSGGDLRSYLNNTLRRPPPEVKFGAWLAQIASGLDFIHSMGVLHRNVKTTNIMVDHVDGQVTLKIGDFAMSRMLLQPDVMAKSQVGTPYFMSPEILNGRQYNMKTDIWSFGCTAYEMATLTTIFHAKTITTLLSGINKHKATQVTKNMGYSSFFQTLIVDMLQKEPAARPDAGEILTRLLNEGFKTTHQNMTATLTSTLSSTRTRTNQGQGQLDSKTVLWSGMDSSTSGIVSDTSGIVSDTSGMVSGTDSMVIHDVSNPPWCDIDKDDKARSAEVAVVPPVMPRPGGRPRTKSEGGVPDIDRGLQEFSKLQRERKLSQSKLHKSVTFNQSVLTSEIPEGGVTEGKEKEEVEELSSEDKGKILRQIEETQRYLAHTLGDGVFTAAFSTLNIRTDAKMERELASVLGDKYTDFEPSFAMLRALEKTFTEQRDDGASMKQKPLNKTI